MKNSTHPTFGYVDFFSYICLKNNMCTFRQALNEIIEDDIQDLFLSMRNSVYEAYDFIKDYFNLKNDKIKITKDNGILIEVHQDNNFIEEIKQIMNKRDMFLTTITPTFEDSVILQFVPTLTK